MKMLLLSIGTLLMLITGITAQNVLETGTETLNYGFVYTPQEGGSGWNCVKYSVTLPGGVNSDIIAGVVTLANGNAIYNAIVNINYASVDQATNDVKSKLVAGSECSFGSSPTCSRVVGLSQSETYAAGVSNRGYSSTTFTYTISECTDAEAASVSSGITLNGLLGLTSAIIVALVLA